MRFHRATLADCSQAGGAVVVIDVIRAFTTAAYAFSRGARQILLVRTIAEALALRRRLPGALVMGEVGGMPVEGFDFGNSPSQLANVDLTGCRLIQRTSAGTQGVVLSSRADHLLAASFTCARATARLISQLNPRDVTFVITGRDDASLSVAQPLDLGDEDASCADYLEALLRGRSPDPEPYLQRVLNSQSGLIFADPAQPEFPAEDLPRCIELDRFDFAMQARREQDWVVLERVKE